MQSSAEMRYISEVHPKRGGRSYFLLRAPKSHRSNDLTSHTFSYTDESGTRERALDAAKMKRDTHLTEIFGNDVLTSNRPKIHIGARTKAAKNSKSGVVGVSLVTNNKPKNKFTYWTAIWREGSIGNRVTKHKGFSTNKYGYDEAFRMACELREKMVAEHATGVLALSDKD